MCGLIGNNKYTQSGLLWFELYGKLSLLKFEVRNEKQTCEIQTLKLQSEKWKIIRQTDEYESKLAGETKNRIMRIKR